MLPSKIDFVDLVIKDVHHRVKHRGGRDTLTTLREFYWVVRGREATKRIVKELERPQISTSNAFKSQPTPDLHDMCVADVPPFVYTSLDFVGPLYITSSKESHREEY